MSSKSRKNRRSIPGTAVAAAVAVALIFSLAHCGKGKPGKDDQGLGGCPAAPGGTPWVPSVPGASAGNHDAPEATSVMREQQTSAGPLTGLTQGALAGRELTFTIPAEEDLGPNGSISLVAEIRNLPSGLEGSAYPFLVSLHDGEQELIRLPRAGAGDDCGAQGYFACTSDRCVARPGCQLQAGSAYFNHGQWLTHQTGMFGPYSVNSFPTCNWDTGTPACPFNAGLFADGQRLRSGPGVRYTARYVMISDSYLNVPLEYRADLKLTVLKKLSTAASAGGIDLNVILVGSKNVEASRTARGQRNLNLLLGRVRELYGQPGVGIQLGAIRAVEWNCAQGGDAQANVDYAKLGQLFKSGAALLPDETDSKALNIYIVSGITDGGSLKQFTTLGVSGGIGGPMVNSTGGSGLVFSSLNHLDRFNPACGDAADCPLASQEPFFIDMGGTITHEMGHFLGLSHVSENDGKTHDLIPDTPACTKTQNLREGVDVLTIDSCKEDTNRLDLTGKSCAEACPGYDGKEVFCPAQLECEFNHVMWWTAKNVNPASGGGDGNLFSPASVKILKYNPYIR